MDANENEYTIEENDEAYSIFPPSEGKVFLELSWKEARVLAAILFTTDLHLLQTQAPVLKNFALDMVDIVGPTNLVRLTKYGTMEG